MAILTRMFLNPQLRGGRKLISNPQALHAAVMASFPPDAVGVSGDSRVLWRLDRSGTRHTLYLLSPVQPDLRHVMEQGGWSGQAGDSRDYDGFLGRLRIGQEWGFRVAANPVGSIPQPGKRGKLVPHVTVAQQTEWFLGKTEHWGFTVRGDVDLARGQMGDVAVTDRQDLRFGRDGDAAGRGRTVTLRRAQFEGSLQVTDSDRFQKALVSGMGRAKAYGCGLMTLREIGPSWPS